MKYTRRDFGKLALAGVPAAGLLEKVFAAPALAAAGRPDSLINGVQIGTITYSYRSMPDQSGDATLQYIIDSGISAVELMSGPAEQFAGAPASGRGGGGERRGEQQTPEQQAAQRAAAGQLEEWRLCLDGQQGAAEEMQRRRRHHLRLEVPQRTCRTR